MAYPIPSPGLSDPALLAQFELSPDAIVLVDGLGNVTHWNSRFLEMTGFSSAWAALPQAERQRELFGLVDDPTGAAAFTLRAFSGPLTSARQTFRLRSGRSVDVYSVPLADRTGAPLGRAFHYRDISSLVEAEHRLRESDGRYRALLSGLVEGVVLQDATGSVVASNEAAQRLLGLGTDELLGATSHDTRWETIYEDGTPFPGEDHPASVSLRDGVPCRDVVMGVRRSDGVLRWMLANSQPIFEVDGGRPTAVVVSFLDITDRHAAERRLRHRRNLESATILAGGVAHQINNHLTAMAGNVFLALGQPPEVAAEYLAEVSQAIAKAGTLVNELVALAHPEPFSPTSVSLRSVVADAINEAFLLAGVLISLEDTSGIDMIQGEASRLIAAVAELIENAVETGTDQVRVRIRKRESLVRHPEAFYSPAVPEPRDYAVIDVWNPSDGISLDIVERAFQPFFSTKGPGRGLGLSVASAIAEAHGGCVKIVTGSSGTTVSLLIPA